MSPATKPFELAFCKSYEPTKPPAGFPHRWIMEPKLDGFRLQVIIDPLGEIATYTRTNHVATGKMPAVETAMRELSEALAGTVLDGEAVYIDECGKADFNFTARVMGSGADVARTKQRVASKYVSFMAFDILWLQGRDVRGLPLKERRLLLERVVRAFESDHIVVTPQAPPSDAQHRFYTEAFGEGSVLKDLEAPYKAGRSKAMLKWKKVDTEDVVVMGMEPGKGKFAGQVGAVIFGQYKDGVLVERGQCSGMDDATRLRFTSDLPIGRVMEITHNGVLAGDKFRHPQFARLRDINDKRAEECTWS